MLLAVASIIGSIACFVFEDYVAQQMTVNGGTLAAARSHMNALGLCCIVLSCILISGTVSGIMVITPRKIAAAIVKMNCCMLCLVGFALAIGGGIIVDSKTGGSWAPVLFLVMGVLTIIVSVVGYCGAQKNSEKALWWYQIFIFILFAVMLILSIYLYDMADSPDALAAEVDKNWVIYQKTMPDKDMTKEGFTVFFAQNLKALALIGFAVSLYLLIGFTAVFYLRWCLTDDAYKEMRDTHQLYGISKRDPATGRTREKGARI